MTAQAARASARVDSTKMAIRIDITGNPLERLTIVASPLLEAVLSLHVLSDPSHHALHHPWVRRMRRSPPWLRREIAAFAPAFTLPLPAFVFPPSRVPLLRFDDELERLRLLDAGELGEELGLPGDPVATTQRFLEFLCAYWEAGFALEWQRVERHLGVTVAESGNRLRTEGFYGLVARISPFVRADAGRGEIVVTAAEADEVLLRPEDRLLLAPSAFVWPHVLVDTNTPGFVALVYPAPFVLAGAKPRLPPCELMKVLRALADETRIQALSLIAQRPRSTQELARLIGITEGTLSRHLRQLMDAGLLTSRRDGYYVLYSLTPEKLGWLAQALPTFVGVGLDPTHPESGGGRAFGERRTSGAAVGLRI
jgi:DNA-binding transcriptional ArsR family regulator